METITIKHFPDRDQFEAFCPLCQRNFALFVIPDVPDAIKIKAKNKVGWMAQHKNHVGQQKDEKLLEGEIFHNPFYK